MRQPQRAVSEVRELPRLGDRFVDFGLRRRAVLRDVEAGRVGVSEVCDASPYLTSAARFHGEPTDRHCPICRRRYLDLVHYVFGDGLKAASGQARSRSELRLLAQTQAEFQVYAVEVCRGCRWNYLVQQYVLGRRYLPAPPRVRASGVAATSPK